ncbi:hypothetical protein DXG01_015621 [Tephrocybe rancida]|nr:hypothetical protein DXG01_015621 [Tephrocybe rancida]
MFAVSSLLTTLILVLEVSANPVVVRDSPVKLSLVRRLDITNLRNLVQQDLARVKYLHSRGEAMSQGSQFNAAPSTVNEPIDNTAVGYVASIGVGSPPTTYNLLVDSGSSNTWIGARTAYNVTSTSVKTSNNVSALYGSGYFTGTEYTDTVTIASGLAIPDQSIGVASFSIGFGTHGFDGSLSPDGSSLIATVTDNAFSKGLIAANQIGISFEAAAIKDIINGEISWGGVDTTKYTGSIAYAPITATSPAKHYWGIDQSILYGTSTNVLNSTAGIVDTGATFIYLASDAYERYRTATGAVLDHNTGLLSITNAQLATLESLFFNINGVTFEFTANAQLWPRSLNTALGGSAGNNYLIVTDIGTPTGNGLDFINGYTFLERFYTVFDTSGERVGFATTPYTNATIN